MLTPVDISNKEFKKSFRGYDVDDVDEFLDMICEDYEKVYKENMSTKEKLQMTNEKLEHYSEIEATIQNTLLLAQNAAEQAKKSAEKEAELIVKSANENAKQILDKANNDVIKVNDDYDRTKQEFAKFISKFRNFMNSQLEMFESLEKDFVKNYSIAKPVDEIKEKEIDKSDTDEDLDKSEADRIEKSDLNDIKSFYVNEEK